MYMYYVCCVCTWSNWAFLLSPDNEDVDDEDEASRSEAETSIKHENTITDDRMNGSESTVVKLHYTCA